MRTGTNDRALALLHLVCGGCVSRLDENPESQARDPVRKEFRRALKGSVGRLLDAPSFSGDLVDARDLSWQGAGVKQAREHGGESPEAALPDDAGAEQDGLHPLLAEESCPDWSAVGYDPKYRAIRRLDAQEELRYVVLAKVGDRYAQHKLIVHHLPLLKMVARRYADKGLSLSELVNEGIFGLIRALDRFEIERKLRFGTYAKWWIRDAMEQSLLKQSRLIRLPGHVVRARSAQQRAAESESGDDVAATDEEVTAALAMHESNSYFGVEAEWDERAEDRAEGVEDATPETMLGDKQRVALLERGLAQLSERERAVVVRRFGLYNDTPETLEAVAADLGVSYERVRQIQNSALAKLKSLMAL